MLVPAPWCWRAGGWGGPSALCLLQESSQCTERAHYEKKKHLPLPQQASSLPLSLVQATVQPLLRDGSERRSHFVFFLLPWLFYHTRCTCHAPAMPLPLTSITPSLSSQNTSDRGADPCAGICPPGRFGKQPAQDRDAPRAESRALLSSPWGRALSRELQSSPQSLC